MSVKEMAVGVSVVESGGCGIAVVRAEKEELASEFREALPFTSMAEIRHFRFFEKTNNLW